MVLLQGGGGGRMDIASCFWHFHYKSEHLCSTGSVPSLPSAFFVSLALIVYAYYF